MIFIVLYGKPRCIMWRGFFMLLLLTAANKKTLQTISKERFVNNLNLYYPITTLVQLCLSGSVPYWIPRSKL